VVRRRLLAAAAATATAVSAAVLCFLVLLMSILWPIDSGSTRCTLTSLGFCPTANSHLVDCSVTHVIDETLRVLSIFLYLQEESSRQTEDKQEISRSKVRE
jgi:hypothetical protein